LFGWVGRKLAAPTFDGLGPMIWLGPVQVQLFMGFLEGNFY